MDIGNRIKQLRLKKGLTLEELADRCELTKGYLSQLERNITTASIPTLEDITEVLGISMSNFFKHDGKIQELFSEDDYYIKEFDDSTIKWLVPDAQKNEMEPILYELESHAESFVVKPHEGEEFGYILRGNVKLVNLNDGSKKSLKKGDTFYLKGDYEHYLVNDSDKIVRLIWVCTPPIF